MALARNSSRAILDSVALVKVVRKALVLVPVISVVVLV